MSKTVQLLIEGDPIAKMRARLRLGFKEKRLFDDQALQRQKMRFYAQRQLGEQLTIAGPCKMDIVFYMPIKRGYQVPENTIHYYRPELGLLLDWATDLVDKIAFTDICHIYSTYAQKLYSRNPRTVISLIEVDQHTKGYDGPF